MEGFAQMARPRSKEKEYAIVQAAIPLIASHGTNAPTTAIAAKASVAEGTIFRYFPNKDELLNAVYFHLKESIREAIADGCSPAQPQSIHARRAWNNYIQWGLAHPDAGRALNLLSVSDRITPENRAASDAFFPDLQKFCESTDRSLLGEHRPLFLDSVFFSVAGSVMDFANRHPDRADAFMEVGFRMFWTAVNEADAGQVTASAPPDSL
ncbi:TetR/AcrR family transcriptional regulator [Agrobacterium fabrum]|uniref:TetR/AcrR family transcriptional regulator n=1 Tax=Agrobacterium fabrum TaxID=1176649 RepID=UPI0021589A45|nr:TetR/AcrR family transcriptional regulator [Agrobacterium fabrum]MCR6727718.1 TetR/AcrR family transcriptional regulator [Agrobacterium fabrum]